MFFVGYSAHVLAKFNDNVVEYVAEGGTFDTPPIAGPLAIGAPARSSTTDAVSNCC
jgi:hypothetical protein